MVCPLSIVGVRGVRVGVGNAPFTVILSVVAVEIVVCAAEMPLATVVPSVRYTQYQVAAAGACAVNDWAVPVIPVSAWTRVAPVVQAAALVVDEYRVAS